MFDSMNVIKLIDIENTEIKREAPLVKSSKLKLIKAIENKDLSSAHLWMKSALERGDEYKACGLLNVLEKKELNEFGRDGDTLLCSAIKFNRNLAAIALLEAGANPDAACENGRLPIYTALRAKNEVMVAALLDFNFSNKMREELGQDAPVRYAARFGLFNAFNVLLPHADLNERDQNGNRLIDYVRKFSSKEILEEMLKYDQNISQFNSLNQKLSLYKQSLK